MERRDFLRSAAAAGLAAATPAALAQSTETNSQTSKEAVVSRPENPFKPFSQEQTATFLSKTKDAAMKGKFEPFKTSSIFDGTANNPKWLGGTSGTDVKPSSPTTESKRVG